MEHQVVDSLFELFDGAAQNAPPSWTTRTLGEATVAIVDALGTAASNVVISSEHRPESIVFAPAGVESDLWPGSDTSTLVSDEVTVSGLLDRADLRSGRFRIRDSVGQDIVLDQVENSRDVGRWLGVAVSATGVGVTNAAGRLVRLRSALIEPVAWPNSVAAWPRGPEWATVGPTRIPDEGLPGVEDQEIDDFVASLEG